MTGQLIADIGGTSSRWALLRKGVGDVIIENLPGHNPATGDADAFIDALNERFRVHPELLAADSLVIYGAGCGNDQRRSRMGEILREVWPIAAIEVRSDLLGAARGLCGSTAGLVLILGTGMNAGWYDGGRLHQPMPSLGYLLGDEGSGADIGKHVLRDALYGRLPADLYAQLFPEPLELSAVIQRLYLTPAPQPWLASFAAPLSKFLDDPYVHQLINGRFATLATTLEQFFSPEQRASIVATGSVAFGLQDMLGSCLAEHGMRLTAVERSPLKGLLNFHREQAN